MGSKKYSAFDIVVSSPPTAKKHALLFKSAGRDSKFFREFVLPKPTYIAWLSSLSYRNYVIVLMANLVLPRFLSPLNSMKFP